jgi:hypothetical protein
VTDDSVPAAPAPAPVTDAPTGDQPLPDGGEVAPTDVDVPDGDGVSEIIEAIFELF